MSMPATGEWEILPRPRVRPGVPEEVAYVSLRPGPGAGHHAIGVVDLGPGARTAGKLVWQVPLPASRTAGPAPLGSEGITRLALEHADGARLAVLDTRVMHHPRLLAILNADRSGWYASRVEILTLSRQIETRRDPIQRLAAYLAPRLRVLDPAGGEPQRALGFAAAPVSPSDLSATLWAWTMPDGAAQWRTMPILTIPAEPASRSLLPPLLHQWGAVPPLVSDLRLSTDRRTLLVACWGTGALLRYDVTRPEAPRLLARLGIGGIANRAGHPSRPALRLEGGPQRITLSPDGRHAYVTNGLGSDWDSHFYPGGVHGWMARAELAADGSMRWDRDFLVRFPDGALPDQVWLKRAGR